MKPSEIRPGTRVTYARGLYVVTRVNSDLLDLIGIADADRVCREAATVLMSDVEVVE